MNPRCTEGQNSKEVDSGVSTIYTDDQIVLRCVQSSEDTVYHYRTQGTRPPPPSVIAATFWTPDPLSAVLGTTVLWVITQSTAGQSVLFQQASLNRVLQSQGNTTQQYHKHDETVEKGPGHEPVQPNSYSVKKKINCFLFFYFLCMKKELWNTHGLVEESMKKDE